MCGAYTAIGDGESQVVALGNHGLVGLHLLPSSKGIQAGGRSLGVPLRFH